MANSQPYLHQPHNDKVSLDIITIPWKAIIRVALQALKHCYIIFQKFLWKRDICSTWKKSGPAGILTYVFLFVHKHTHHSCSEYYNKSRNIIFTIQKLFIIPGYYFWLLSLVIIKEILHKNCDIWQWFSHHTNCTKWINLKYSGIILVQCNDGLIVSFPSSLNEKGV